jgi:hypothetical protein
MCLPSIDFFESISGKIDANNKMIRKRKGFEKEKNLIKTKPKKNAVRR